MKLKFILGVIGFCLLYSVYSKHIIEIEKQEKFDIQLKQSLEDIAQKRYEYLLEKEHKETVYEGIVKQYSYINRNIQ
jgi:hypothetical protein